MSLKSALDKFGADGNIDTAELKSLKMDYFSDAGYKKFAQEMQIHQRRRGLKLDGSKRTYRPDAALESIGYQKGGLDRWKEWKNQMDKNIEEASPSERTIQWDWGKWEKSDEGKRVKEAAMRGEPLGTLQFNTTSDPTDDNFEPEFQISYLADAQTPQANNNNKQGYSYESNVEPYERLTDFTPERQDVSAIDKKYSLDKIQARIDETTKNALPSPKAPKLNYKREKYGKVPSFKQLRREAKKTIKKDVAFNPDPLKISMLPDRLIKERKKEVMDYEKSLPKLGPVNDSGKKDKRKILRSKGEFSSRFKNTSKDSGPMRTKGPLPGRKNSSTTKEFQANQPKISKEFKR